jgi:membrane-bound metal-dependent hydrolase YbcI (DUF457 family)
MPFTPYHFGPNALIGLSLNKYIDLPVFVLTNVVVDLEVLAVVLFNLNYPLHGPCHTFLVGIVVGIICGLIAYPFRNLFQSVMNFLQLSYQPGVIKMAVSGVLSVWLHVTLDSIVHWDVQPFWPIAGNPLFKLVSVSTIFTICEVCCIAAVIIFPALVYSAYRKRKANPN